MNIMTKLLLCSKARTSFLPSIWISIELLHMHTIRETILFSLSIYLSSQFSDEHPKEIEELWATLCGCWPNNLKVIIRYLIIVSGMAPQELLPYVSIYRYTRVLILTLSYRTRCLLLSLRSFPIIGEEKASKSRRRRRRRSRKNVLMILLVSTRFSIYSSEKAGERVWDSVGIRLLRICGVALQYMQSPSVDEITNVSVWTFYMKMDFIYFFF